MQCYELIVLPRTVVLGDTRKRKKNVLAPLLKVILSLVYMDCFLCGDVYNSALLKKSSNFARDSFDAT
jgi:hypothetical protein